MGRFLLIAMFALLLAALPAAAQSQEKCFESDWLQQSHQIKFKASGTSVSGRFTVSRDGEDISYDFTGVLKGKILTVKFAGAKMPDISPSEMKGLAWTISPKGTGEVLKIKVYGKNYQTNKYEISYAEYTPCAQSYNGPAAKMIAFARGENSAKLNLSFADKDEWKTFSISAKKGQSLVVEAYGCGIKVYLPNGKIHEENEEGTGKASTLLDVVSIFPLQQTGTYTVMLRNAGGNPQRSREIIFKITD